MVGMAGGLSPFLCQLHHPEGPLVPEHWSLLLPQPCLVNILFIQSHRKGLFFFFSPVGNSLFSQYRGLG